jgi:hypothetical protein
VLVPNSGHGIPVEAPDAVISAVREIVTTVRDDLHYEPLLWRQLSDRCWRLPSGSQRSM